MLFNSIEFAVFLPIVFILYWFIGKKTFRFQNILLLFASYYFYSCWDWRFLFLLLFSTVFDYFVGFILGMVRLLTNILTTPNKETGLTTVNTTNGFWESTTWFWQTNWLIFEIWLLVFIMLMMVVVSFFTKKPTAQQIEFISFTGDYKKLIKQSWDKWDVIASLGVVIACALFYWYFW